MTASKNTLNNVTTLDNSVVYYTRNMVGDYVYNPICDADLAFINVNIFRPSIWSLLGDRVAHTIWDSVYYNVLNCIDNI